MRTDGPPRTTYRRAHPVRRAGVLACLVALIGCGGDDRIDISGTVIFNGKPVPAGRIYFTPDLSKGHDGPQGYAEILDGAFDTSKEGKGPRGGPTIVTIHGYDGAKEIDSGSQGNPLFLDYHVSIDLPAATTTQKFEVPASAAADVPKGPRTGPKP